MLKTIHFIFSIGFCFVCENALATTFINRPLGEAVKESAFIVRGKAGESYSDWDKQGQRRVYTYTYFNVVEVLRGNLKESQILVRQPGGSKDGMEMNVPGVAHFQLGEEVVLLLGEHNSEDDSYDVPGFTTGKYNLVKGERGETFLVNSLGGAAIYDPNKDAKTQSYNSRIPLDVFRRIAKGEEVPEASSPQFKGSQKPAPKGAFEADHDQHSHPRQPQRPAPVPTKVAGPTEPIEEESSGGGLWVPLSFALLALSGIAIFLIATRSKGDE